MNLQAHIITTPSDSQFMRGYCALNNYFGHRNEMEAIEVLTSRLTWRHTTLSDTFQLHYEMAVLLDESGELACTGDYSVILDRTSAQPAVVHLSHIRIEPPFQKKGIFNQHMIPLIIAAAENAKQIFNKPANLPVVIVGEMDHPFFNHSEETIPRINLFIRAGLRLVDPGAATYYQPDFRSFAEIDAAGAAEGLPLALMLRWVGREYQAFITGSELLHIVKSLYAMYGKTFRVQDMAVVYKTLTDYPDPDGLIPLLTEIPDRQF